MSFVMAQSLDELRRDKADQWRLDATDGNVARMAHELREIAALVDGLRLEIQADQAELARLRQEIEELRA